MQRGVDVHLHNIWHEMERYALAIQRLNKAGDNGGSKRAELFYLLLLNLVYDRDLIDLNQIKPNHPAIDLGSRRREVAVQIACQAQDPESKIRKTCEAFIDSELYRDYRALEIIFPAMLHDNLYREYYHEAGFKVTVRGWRDICRDIEHRPDKIAETSALIDTWIKLRASTGFLSSEVHISKAKRFNQLLAGMSLPRYNSIDYNKHGGYRIISSEYIAQLTSFLTVWDGLCREIARRDEDPLGSLTGYRRRGSVKAESSQVLSLLPEFEPIENDILGMISQLVTSFQTESVWQKHYYWSHQRAVSTGAVCFCWDCDNQEPLSMNQYDKECLQECTSKILRLDAMIETHRRLVRTAHPLERTDVLNMEDNIVVG